MLTNEPGFQERTGAEMPRTVTPRGRSLLTVLSEQQQLHKELAAEKAAREAAEARALVSADEAAAAVSTHPWSVQLQPESDS